MKESDYIRVSDLARLRAIMSILRQITPENTAEPMGVHEEQALSEYRFIGRCLDSWIARLEEAPKEPLRKVFPVFAGAHVSGNREEP